MHLELPDLAVAQLGRAVIAGVPQEEAVQEAVEAGEEAVVEELVAVVEELEVVAEAEVATQVAVMAIG